MAVRYLGEVLVARRIIFGGSAFLVFLAALACGGAGGESVEVLEVPVPVAEQGAATPMADDYDSLSGKLDDALIKKIHAATDAFESAQTVEQLKAAWDQALALADPLQQVLQPQFDANDMLPLELDWLLPQLPGMSETYMAEGTALVFGLDAKPWIKAAAATDGDADDTFFALTDHAYSAAHVRGYPAWHNRTWDYGGCTELGRGVIIETLLKVDKAKAEGELFAEPIASIRQAALSEVLEIESGLFPRCDPQRMRPTASGGVQAEARRILREVDLTDDEERTLTGNIPRLNGEAHEGG
ncbi:MAG: hypothetical protein ACI9MC_000418 [Kiritimatiellia bacterium]|jgi:hypothetical protein